MQVPLILDYEIYDEEGPCAPYFTGRITDAEGRVICNAENEERAAELVDYVNTLRARVARLEEALKRGVELHESCDADTCMCGESMWHPLSDHKPIATLQYYGDQWAEEARRALEEK